jgi:hypothetical protein
MSLDNEVSEKVIDEVTFSSGIPRRKWSMRTHLISDSLGIPVPDPDRAATVIGTHICTE